MDSDTYITGTISEFFEILELVDFAITQEFKLTSKTENLDYKNIFPEFNSGVIVFRNSVAMKKVLDDWLTYCIDKGMGNDMPGLREAVL